MATFTSSTIGGNCASATTLSFDWFIAGVVCRVWSHVHALILTFTTRKQLNKRFLLLHIGLLPKGFNLLACV